MALTIRQELIKLRKLKNANLAAGKKKTAADTTFKKHQAHVLTRMEAEEIESLKSSGTLFVVVEKVKGGIEDRAEYVKYALDEDAGLQEFIEKWTNTLGDDRFDPAVYGPQFQEELYATITGLSLLSLKEDTGLLNKAARAHVDDGIPMPPGVSCRPDPYISQTTK